MLFADARSVREERSRQRYALQDFSQIRVSLVKGRKGWKIGSVEVFKNDFMDASSRAVRGSVVAIYRTLRRFIHGEEASPELFDFCREALALVSADMKARQFFEQLTQVQILRLLGYVDENTLPQPVRDLSATSDLLKIDDTYKTEISRLILQSVEHSQL
jgi:recombinational DNA repair protein (RecF pathway)